MLIGQGEVLEVFGLEADLLGRELATLAEPDWDLPTGCRPWRVRDLLAHVRVVIAWLPGMLMVQAPEQAEVSALAYYRPDARFDAETNARRITLAQSHATSMIDGVSLLADFNATWQQAVRLVGEEPEGRVVRTRHGDAMLLSEFLVTRVVEVAERLGWSKVDFICRAAGRRPISVEGNEKVSQLGIRWLTLG